MFLKNWASNFYSTLAVYCLACYLISPAVVSSGFAFGWVLLAPVTVPVLLLFAAAMIGAREVGTDIYSVMRLFAMFAVAIIVSLLIFRLAKRFRFVLPVSGVLLCVYLLAAMQFVE